MRTLLIEEAYPALEEMKTLLRKHFPLVEIAGIAITATDAMQQVEKLNPDLVLLGIHLSDKEGIDLLTLMGSHPFALVYITNHSTNTLQPIRLAAVDYLLKPLSIEQLAIALFKANQQLLQQQTFRQLINLLQFVQQDRKQERIALPLANETRLLYPKDILHCQAKGSYTYFFLSSKEQLVVAKGLYHFTEQLLGHGFIQVSVSALVNTAHIKSICRKDNVYELLLVDSSSKVHVSRAYVEEVKGRLYGGKKKEK